MNENQENKKKKKSNLGFIKFRNVLISNMLQLGSSKALQGGTHTSYLNSFSPSTNSSQTCNGRKRTSPDFVFKERCRVKNAILCRNLSKKRERERERERERDERSALSLVLELVVSAEAARTEAKLLQAA